MYKGRAFSLLRYNRFEFGEQTVSQLVIFECKYLFSLIIFYFHRSAGSQDRFHTHAFNALSIKLFGQYSEYVLDDESSGRFHMEQRTSIFKRFPRNSYHKIGNSTGCCTILLSGPWKSQWKEYIDGGKIINYTWNRKIEK